MYTIHICNDDAQKMSHKKKFLQSFVLTKTLFTCATIQFPTFLLEIAVAVFFLLDHHRFFRRVWLRPPHHHHHQTFRPRFVAAVSVVDVAPRFDAAARELAARVGRPEAGAV